MMIKFLRVASFYPDMISDFHEKGDWSNVSYAETKRVFLEQNYGQGESHEKNLRRLGYVADNIIYDAEFIQRKWCLDAQGLDRFELLARQVESFAPDVLYIENVFAFTSNELRDLRVRVPSIRVMFGFLGSAFTHHMLEVLRSYNFVVTCDPEMRDQFKAAGLDVLLVMHAFDPDVLNRIGLRSNRAPESLSFIGSLVAGERFHSGRIALLDHLVEGCDNLEIYGQIVSGTSHLGLVVRPLALLGEIWNRSLGQCGWSIPNVLKRAQMWVPRERAYMSPRLKAAVRPPVYGLDMYKTLRDSLITLNATIQSARFIANMRLFEATGVGTCVVTDFKENLPELFEVGVEVVAYSSKEECADKIKWLMKNPAEANAIALRGQQRCLRDHVYARRTPILDNAIRARL